MKFWVIFALAVSAVAASECDLYLRVKCGNSMGHPDEDYSPKCDAVTGYRYNNKCHFMNAWCIDKDWSKFTYCAYADEEGSGAIPTTPVPTRVTTMFPACRQYANVNCNRFSASRVCDYSGNTYRNWCEFKQAQCENNQLRSKRCTGPRPTTPAPTRPSLCEKYKNYDCSRYPDARQVCDDKGKVYKNYCELRKAFYCDRTLMQKRCPPANVYRTAPATTTTKKPDMCGHYQKVDCRRFSSRVPVCDNKGNTYKNSCMFQKAKCKDTTIEYARCQSPVKLRTTTPVPTKKPWDICSYYQSRDCSRYGRSKVCDNEGGVYKNSCEFQKAKCNDTSLVPVRCPVQFGTTTPKPTKCDYYKSQDCSAYRPHKMCDSKGNVYENGCEYQKAQCNDTTLRPAICPQPTKKPWDACDYYRLRDCSKSQQTKLCVNNGNVYMSSCEYMKARCNDTTLRQVRCPVKFGTTTPKPTRKPTNTACDYYKSRDCAKWAPYKVCDAEGKEYRNRCAFTKAQCADPSVKRAACQAGSGEEKTTPAPTADYRCKSYFMKLDCSRYSVQKTCGDDGKAYRNKCTFKKAQCQNPGLKQARCN